MPPWPRSQNFCIAKGTDVDRIVVSVDIAVPDAAQQQRHLTAPGRPGACPGSKCRPAIKWSAVGSCSVAAGTPPPTALDRSAREILCLVSGRGAAVWSLGPLSTERFKEAGEQLL